MIPANPVILKEFVQAARRRRTYLLRVGLPLLAMIVLAPQVINLLDRYGQDWRSLARVGRPAFVTCAWLQLAAFSVFAFVYGTATIQEEWTNRTMEVLCAAPLSSAAIVYGKFAGTMGKVLLAALGLLPVMGILYLLASMPREIVLGSMAVIAGSVLLCASLGLLQASAFEHRRRLSAGSILIVAPYFLMLTLLYFFVWEGHPILAAAIPPLALGKVLAGTAPAPWTTGEFALMSLGISAGVSLAALLLAPWLFSRTFARHIGATRGRRRGLRFRRLMRGKRPRMARHMNPFYWQELGPRTRPLRWALWLVFGITGVFVVVAGVANDSFDFIEEEGFFVLLGVESLITLIVVSALYGAAVFAQEKPRQTADALLLTGTDAGTFYLAKLGALYRALIWQMVAAGFCCAKWLTVMESEPEAYVLVFELILLGPAFAAVVGMTFSVFARTPARALIGLLGSVVWAVVLVWVVGMLFIETFGVMDRSPAGWLVLSLIVMGLMLALARRWSPWRLSLLLAVCFFVAGAGMATAMEHADAPYEREGAAMLEIGNFIVFALTGIWLALGLLNFDRGMRGERAGTLPLTMLRTDTPPTWPG